MATGCDISLQLREGVGWHQWCRRKQAGEESRACSTGWRGAAVLGKCAASCAVPCSIIPGGTQARHCRRWGCCGHAECDWALCSSACHRFGALLPLCRALGAPWHCCAYSGLWLCPAPPAKRILGPGSAKQSQRPSTTAGSRCCHGWLEPPSATPSGMLAGGACAQGGWIGGWGGCRGHVHVRDARAGLSLGGQSRAAWEGLCASWNGDAGGLADR